MRQVIMYKDEDDYWVVECPSLKGCVSQGKTKQEALSNIKEAITGYIAALEEDGLAVEEFVSLLRSDRHL
ncbi:MAG: type II toxin-antitoxin system HicB family antitoxin [Tolypothrix carrinoi HA7290-LM1]|nr:type II toxin-antitoxin system HicB family antitoxin [Tolypothrix carrinoi HA7290-LM1]